MKFKKNILGFTLIELMVAVLVIVVLTGIGAYSLNGFNKNREVEAMKNEMSNQVKLARNLAITNQTPDGSLTLNYVRISIVDKQMTTTAVNGANEIIGDFSTKNFSVGVGNTTINFGFDGITGRLVNYDDGELSTDPITITVTDGSVTSSFNINDLGIVSNEE